jgi:hypothetical protein
MAVTLNASASAGLITTADTSTILQLQTGGTTAVTVDASQNVGIGTASPDTSLAVRSTGANGINLGESLNNSVVSSRLFFSNATAGQSAAIYNNSGGLLFTTGATLGSGSGTERMRIDSSGNVGVGTTSPSRFIDFEKNQNASTILRVGNTTSGTGAYSALQLSSSSPSYLYNFSNSYATSGIFVAGATVLDAGGSGGLSFNAASVGIIFNTASTERARIDSSGNLLVGATASANSTYSVATFRGSTKGIAIQDSSTGNYRAIYGQSGALYFYNGTNEGNLSSAGAWVNASDAKLKNSIVDIKYGLTALMNTQPRSYKMNDLDGDYVGFVAQELQQIIPEVVSGDPEKQLGVDYGSLVAVAFKAIQEQQAIIQTLTDRITALEGTTPCH